MFPIARCLYFAFSFHIVPYYPSLACQLYTFRNQVAFDLWTMAANPCPTIYFHLSSERLGNLLEHMREKPSALCITFSYELRNH